MRIGGTFLGAILGMVCWYIGESSSICEGCLWLTGCVCVGAGKGTGNPYGLAAITAAFTLVLVFFRINAPPQYLVGVLMSGVSRLSLLQRTG